MSKPRRSFFSHHDRARTLDAIAALRRGLVTVCAGHDFSHPAAEAARKCFDAVADLETALTGKVRNPLRDAPTTPRPPDHPTE